MVRTENDKINSLICECFDKDLKLLDKSRRRDIKRYIGVHESSISKGLVVQKKYIYIIFNAFYHDKLHHLLIFLYIMFLFVDFI